MMINEMPSYLKIEKLFELMNIGDDESLERLQEIAKKDKCELVRHEAVFALGEIPTIQSIDFLKKLLQEDPSYVVQHEVLVTLGTIGKEENIEFIKPYTKHKDLEISNSAKIALSRIEQKEDFENEVLKNKNYYKNRLLEKSDADENERIQIIFQLMRDGKESDIKTISQSLKNDPCPIVRHEAGFALGEIGNSLAIKEMGEALEKETASIVIHETLFALGTTGKKKALDIIEPYLNNKDYVISESAIIAKQRIEKLKNPYSGIKYFNE